MRTTQKTQQKHKLSHTIKKVSKLQVKQPLHKQPLHVITVVFTPLGVSNSQNGSYSRRYKLTKEFIKRMETQEKEQKDILFYLVEMVYGDQPFSMTDSKNPKHLQLRTEHPLWHQENMINIGIKKLLPANWKTVAWVDADMEFENKNWAKETLTQLNTSKDIVQLFDKVSYLDKHNREMDSKFSFGYRYVNGYNYKSIKKSMEALVNGTKGGTVGGGAWACTRYAYNKMKKIYDLAALGGNDKILAFSIIGKVQDIYILDPNSKYTNGYKQSILEYQDNLKNLRLGYIPGTIKSFYHGKLKNRKYGSRHEILIRNHYDPTKHMTYDANGLLIPTSKCPHQLLSEIQEYFRQRKEDD